MDRVYNFSAGPSNMPIELLKKAQKELLNFNNSGMSVMEMSHRSKWFDDIIKSAEANLRKIMNIPENYNVLFFQGGAWTQFAMVPINLFTKYNKACYINTGSWATKALKEAKRFGEVIEFASSSDENFSYIPKIDTAKIPTDIDYIHITANNTIYGTEYKEYPDTKDTLLVADMSSDILSRPVDVSKFGLIYAGAQKNIGPAGVTIVIIRNDLGLKPIDHMPTMLQYKTQIDKNSMFNTPPTFGIYICGLMFEWILENGGIDAVYKNNLKKSELLYNYIDSSDLFSAPVKKEDRSLMNVVFTTSSDELDKKFASIAQEKGFVNLKGHSSIGKLRASIYNAMTLDGVKALIKYMGKFEKENK